jgi:CRP/FNR family cyclic AMP-dependent transcriptional regulator
MATPTVADLAAVPLFASLSSDELQALASLFSVRSYPKHAIVASEGDTLERFNIILSGTVEGFWRDAAGHQLTLGQDEPGSHFGVAALGGEPLLVSFIAIEDLRVASIRVSDWMDVLHRHPQIAVALLLEVIARLRRVLKRTRILTMEDVYGRVVKLLAARAVAAGDAPPAARLTHAEIGQRVGATREMVGRVLRDLARGGYIEMRRGRIVLLREPPTRW